MPYTAVYYVTPPQAAFPWSISPQLEQCRRKKYRCWKHLPESVPKTYRSVLAPSWLRVEQSTLDNRPRCVCVFDAHRRMNTSARYRHNHIHTADVSYSPRSCTSDASRTSGFFVLLREADPVIAVVFIFFSPSLKGVKATAARKPARTEDCSPITVHIPGASRTNKYHCCGGRWVLFHCLQSNSWLIFFKKRVFHATQRAQLCLHLIGGMRRRLGTQ